MSTYVARVRPQDKIEVYTEQRKGRIIARLPTYLGHDYLTLGKKMAQLHYFVATVTRRRKPIFSDSQVRQLLLGLLHSGAVIEGLGIHLAHFYIEPDCLWAIVSCEPNRHIITEWGAIKRRTTKRIGRTFPGLSRPGQSIWTQNNFISTDKIIYRDTLNFYKSLEKKKNMVKINPVPIPNPKPKSPTAKPTPNTQYPPETVQELMEVITKEFTSENWEQYSETELRQEIEAFLFEASPNKDIYELEDDFHVWMGWI